MKYNVKRYNIGDACWCWEFSDRIDPAVNRLILSVYRHLRLTGLKRNPVLDVVPTYNSIAVYFEPFYEEMYSALNAVDKVDKSIREFSENYDPVNDEQAGNRIVLPVIYDGEDICRLASIHDLTVSEVAEIHSSVEYTVAMIGFRPHFPYLIGLDDRLSTPRLDSPRSRVPAGSVAIGGNQTGVYPVDSPGGWNIIGRTDPELLVSIEPGDTVIFTESDVCS